MKGETVLRLPALGLAPSASLVQAQTYGGDAGVRSADGSLPFTGLDVGLLILGALVLILVGATLRRVSSRAR